jgi:hypothetical protein
MRYVTFWLASMTLIMATLVASVVTPEVMEGISGLVIRFFLGYCGIIMIAQLFASLTAIRGLFDEMTNAKPVSHRVYLR